MFGFGKKKEELATDEEVQQVLTGGRVSTEEMARLREAMREQGLMPDSQDSDVSQKIAQLAQAAARGEEFEITLDLKDSGLFSQSTSKDKGTQSKLDELMAKAHLIQGVDGIPQELKDKVMQLASGINMIVGQNGKQEKNKDEQEAEAFWLVANRAALDNNVQKVLPKTLDLPAYQFTIKKLGLDKVFPIDAELRREFQNIEKYKESFVAGLVAASLTSIPSDGIKKAQEHINNNDTFQIVAFFCGVVQSAHAAESTGAESIRDQLWPLFTEHFKARPASINEMLADTVGRLMANENIPQELRDQVKGLTDFIDPATRKDAQWNAMLEDQAGQLDEALTKTLSGNIAEALIDAGDLRKVFPDVEALKKELSDIPKYKHSFSVGLAVGLYQDDIAFPMTKLIEYINEVDDNHVAVVLFGVAQAGLLRRRQEQESNHPMFIEVIGYRLKEASKFQELVAADQEKAKQSASDTTNTQSLHEVELEAQDYPDALFNAAINTIRPSLKLIDDNDIKLPHTNLKEYGFDVKDTVFQGRKRIISGYLFRHFGSFVNAEDYQEAGKEFATKGAILRDYIGNDEHLKKFTRILTTLMPLGMAMFLRDVKKMDGDKAQEIAELGAESFKEGLTLEAAQTEDADSEIAGRHTLAQCIEFHQKNGEPDVADLLTKLSNDKQCVILAAEARSFAVKFIVEDDYGLRDLEADIGKLARKIRETMSNPIEVKVMAASVGAFMFRFNSARAVEKEEDEEQKDNIRKFFHAPITVFHSIVLE
ncbi:TPA: hypothetical protein QDC27_007599 [Burkholderia cepacia ATCC 25416]|nr:hypothetical protein [Burkholderia cepacia ATCC 25416]HDR9779724.1 hypothetical protein [Burkholderia cepacia ATCC 25416]HDR9785813.1 hypothetical protein [Burkholderia cepacia ATCC 25416]HDR9794664.1 hypothetical protein [Burkholderia cepacia ATCC 25416]